MPFPQTAKDFKCEICGDYHYPDCSDLIFDNEKENKKNSKEEIINQLIEFIEYNKDQQEMSRGSYNLGYYRGKISAYQDSLSLIRELK